ncbi:MAG: ATP-binding cassette domain-containing protein [Bacteroidaceae bacterium]|nr:ATP-binding cassette domain-containing protein [Bacteroidaceae bacterium]
MSTVLKYEDVRISQQEVDVLEEVNLELADGEFVYLVGKVGAGKSTFLKTIYVEVPIADGRAKVLDFDLSRLKQREIPRLRRKLGIVFQDFRLLTDRSAHDNLEFVLRATGWKGKREMEHRIDEVLTLVGMQHKGYKLPNELSGGEQQRVVIARAVLNHPQIILADEPTGNLDAETGMQIAALLHRICEEQGTLVIMSTHNKQLMQAYPGKVLGIENHRLEFRV